MNMKIINQKKMKKINFFLINKNKIILKILKTIKIASNQQLIINKNNNKINRIYQIQKKIIIKLQFNHQVIKLLI